MQTSAASLLKSCFIQSIRGTSKTGAIPPYYKVEKQYEWDLMSVADKVLLRKRAIIETINDELKNIAQIEHSIHQCFDNFIVNLLSGIAAIDCS